MRAGMNGSTCPASTKSYCTAPPVRAAYRKITLVMPV